MEGKEVELELLYSKEEIAQRVKALADQISRDYPDGEVMFLGILKGAFIFLADLVRSLSIPSPRIEFVGLSSYGLEAESSRTIAVTRELPISVEGKDVITVEDIIDTGLTLQFLLEELRAKRPRSLKVCALIDKKSRREVAMTPDYVGFELQEGFIVGYGIDYAERYRHLPAIYRVRPSTNLKE
ncbi:MAG: hypoxanthine phosphoribosyltransferase [Candidatus Tectomicrobia bacterium]|nr:hypoxanthine phosphoribosyltransferase [Candidatus Tectomicrobia bacterium]